MKLDYKVIKFYVMNSIDLAILSKNRTECIRSVLFHINTAAQKVNFPIVIRVFDSSDDSAFKIKDKVYSLYPHMSIYRLPNSNTMSENWNEAVKHGKSMYFALITDRTLVHPVFFSRIEYYLENITNIDVISWQWNISRYNNLTVPPRAQKLLVKQLNIKSIVESLFVPNIIPFSYPYYLPRGLNSLISRKALAKIKQVFGDYFSGINPDYTFAFKCLLCLKNPVFVNDILFTSTYLYSSNGGKSLKFLNYEYLNTINNSCQILAKTGISLPLISNTILADYLFVLEQNSDVQWSELDIRLISNVGYMAILVEVYKKYYIIPPTLRHDSIRLIRSKVRFISSETLPWIANFVIFALFALKLFSITLLRFFRIYLDR